jgi:hypothetical protein
MFNYSSLTSVASCNDYLEVKNAELAALNVRLAGLQQRFQNNQGSAGAGSLAQELASAEAAVTALTSSLDSFAEGPLRRRVELLIEDAERKVVQVNHKIRTLGVHGMLNLEIEIHEMAQRIATREAVITAITVHRDSLPPDAAGEAA